MTKQVPSGYKQTKIGIIPEDWEVVKLGDIATIYDGTHMTPDYTTHGVPFYSVETITGDEWNKTKFISEEVFEQESKRVKIEYGDILMTRIGDIGTPKFINWHAKASFYVSLALIKNKNSSNISFEYLAQYVKSHNFQNELHKRTIHVAFPKKINLGEINYCNIIRLPLHEQEKIAEILSTWDDAITKQEQLIEQKQIFKKGIMQQIFSQKLRFKDDNGKNYPAWQNINLGQLCAIKKGIQLSKINMREDGGYPVLNGGVEYSGFTNSYNSEQTITISEGGNSCGYVNYVKTKFWCGGHCYTLQEAIIGQSYLFQLLKCYQHKIMLLRVGSGLPNIQKSALEKFSLIVSLNEQEQTKIANFLTAIDDEITNQTEILSQLKLQKQSLMQKLLTGQIRV
jgi:type I restriction enzyme S subunit